MSTLEGPTVYSNVRTCSRSPIQYHSFGRFDTHLFIVLRMSQRQFYRLLQGQVEEMHVIATITVTQSCVCTFSIVQTLQILMDSSEEEAKREKKS